MSNQPVGNINKTRKDLKIKATNYIQCLILTKKQRTLQLAVMY